MALFTIIYYVVFMSLELATAIIGCRLVRKTWERPYKALVILAVLTIIGEVGTGLLHYTTWSHDAIYIWLTPYETWTILYFFGVTQSGRLLRRLHIFFAASMLILRPLYFFLPSPTDIIFERLLLQSYFNVLLMLASCVVLIQIVKNAMDAPISSFPVFWMAIGILCYSSIFGILNIVGGVPSMHFLAMPFSIAANTCMYGGFIICFVKYSRLQRKPIILP